MAATKVKICGLTSEEAVRASVAAGASYLGFNFFSKSPRSVPVDRVADLATAVPSSVCKVALTVDADDDLIAAVGEALAPDLWQFHGAETPERVAEIKARTGVPVMKVIGVADAGDLDKIAAYKGFVDMILVDAKPPKTAVLPGGNGLTFDWQLLDRVVWETPWMLAGGLRPDNVAEAVRRTGAPIVDVASGVERAPGVKDKDRIQAFMAAL